MKMTTMRYCYNDYNYNNVWLLRLYYHRFMVLTVLLLVLLLVSNEHGGVIVVFFTTSFNIPATTIRSTYLRHSYYNNNNNKCNTRICRILQFTEPHNPNQHGHYMFTGIVEDIGTIIEFTERDDIPIWDGSGTTRGTVMTIQTSSNQIILDTSAYIGCSISVSGVCLTATSIDFQKQQFTVGLAPETLQKTYFGRYCHTTNSSSTSSSNVIGSKVNLERASEIGFRNSGHFVQGHVDDIGTIVDRTIQGDSICYRIQVDSKLMSYIVPKGFIAIDGTSLTVIDTDITSNTFTFMLIEYTQKHVIIPMKVCGDIVNIEVDVIAKYATQTLHQSIIPRLDELERKMNAIQDHIKNLQ